MDRILVGIDFSDASIAAARWTLTRFAPEADAALLHAISIPRPPRALLGRHPDPAPTLENARRGALTRLNEIARAIDRQRPGPPLAFMAAADEAATALLEGARRYRADLIVVARHVPRQAPWDWLGSTAERILADGSFPVLVVAAARDADPTRLLAALDDGEMSPRVIAWTRTLAERFGASVVGVHVGLGPEMPQTMAALGAGGAAIDHFIRDPLSGAVEQRWRDRLQNAGIPADRIHCETRLGAVAQEIVRAADRHASDLIVIGNRSASVFGRSLLGSNVRSVIRRAACPVLVAAGPVETASVLQGTARDAKTAQTR